MDLKTLELVLRLDGKEISRNFGLSENPSKDWAAEDIAEFIGEAIVHLMVSKPEIVKGMLIKLLDEARK